MDTNSGLFWRRVNIDRLTDAHHGGDGVGRVDAVADQEKNQKDNNTADDEPKNSQAKGG